MNKYQEALYELSIQTDKEVVFQEQINGFVSVLQELVDRATPKKPILKISKWSGRGTHSCPVCDWDVFKSQCCSNNDCRQAIDWNK